MTLLAAALTPRSIPWRPNPMIRIVYLTLLFLSANLAIDAGLGENQKIQILKGWGTVVDPDGDCKFAENQGKLTITIPNVAHDFTFRPDFVNQNGPRILQDVEGDFSIQVRVMAFPRPDKKTSSNGKYSFVGSGLLVWLDNKNFIRFERSAEGNSGLLFVWLERFQDGTSVAKKSTTIADKDTELQVERKGTKMSFALKAGGDDQQWMPVQTLDVDLPQKLKVGVHALNTTTKDFSPQLNDLKLTSK
jgi:regulation of enolase protein 1 (concanavalin A-like superfamily)